MKYSIYLLTGCFLIVLTTPACQKEYSCESCNNLNKPPLAFAGSDTIINLPLDSILVNGARSSDSDGSITAWQWSNVSGPSNVVIRSSNTAQTIIAALNQGTYYFELTVTDNDGAVDTDTMKVTVNNPVSVNRPPIANAGVNLVIQLPVDSAILNGSGSSDPDNNISVYSWSMISGPSSYTFGNANAQVTTISNLVEGTYLLSLKVIDAGGLADEDTVQVMVVTPSSSTGVYFFFRDSSGSLDAANITVIEGFSPRIVLAKVLIAGYPDALIEGVWNLNNTLMCPIIFNHADSTAYGIFLGLPPGTYSWTAQSVTTNLTGYPVPAGFLAYWSVPHYAAGTITVPPGGDCILKEIDF